jgi:Zn finger protein HypA/HybF involved in hydrogenase expression
VSGPDLRGARSLAIARPDLAAQWHPTKNDLSPPRVAEHAAYRAWWLCSTCGHEWPAKVFNRAAGSGCPCCANRVTVTGINDLATVRPDLVPDWDPEKNARDPASVCAYTTKRAAWKCSSCGYSWTIAVRNRVCANSGCPACNDRRVLRQGTNDLASQRPDVAAEWHPDKNDSLTPSQVHRSYTKKVWWLCQVCDHEWVATPSNRAKPNGSGCPGCSGRALISGRNDLASQAPELVLEWDVARNTIRTHEVTVGSSRRCWWTCRTCGHGWRAQVAARVRGQGCPACFGFDVVTGLNDLGTGHPQIATEWHPTKNGELGASAFFMRSAAPKWWLCRDCDHEWIAPIANRTVRGTGCPRCNSSGFQNGAPARLYLLEHPKLAALKVGITGQGTKRIARFTAAGWLVVYVSSFSSGAEARQVEQAILRWWRRDLFLPVWLAAPDMNHLGGHSETVSSEDVASPETVLQIRAEIDKVRAKP